MADESVMAALVFAEMAAKVDGSSVESVLRNLQSEDVEFLPETRIDLDAAVEIVLAVKHGSPDLQAVTKQIDIPTAIKSSFVLALAAARRLEAVSETPATEWCKVLASGLAQGHGVD